MARLTKRQLDAWLAYWQPVLRLADWDIEVRSKSRKALGGDDGECSAYPDLFEAEIGVVSGPPSSRFADHETILVHELIHCHMDPLLTPETEKAVEFIVEKLSKAFVALARAQG